MLPTVTVITPTTFDRDAYNTRIKAVIDVQDYPNIIEHSFDYSDNTIGAKRNNLCRAAIGDIIIHADSDDYYAPDWVSRSVAHLIESKADCTGLSSIFFYLHPNNAWQWSNLSNQKIVAGATLCYYKRVWKRNQFKAVNSGEDTIFCGNAGRLIPHTYTNGFLATLHGSNTASHQGIGAKEFRPASPAIAVQILGDNFNKYQ